MLQFGRERSVKSSFAGIENIWSLRIVDMELTEDIWFGSELEIELDEEAESAKLRLRK